MQVAQDVLSVDIVDEGYTAMLKIDVKTEAGVTVPLMVSCDYSKPIYDRKYRQTIATLDATFSITNSNYLQFEIFSQAITGKFHGHDIFRVSIAGREIGFRNVNSISLSDFDERDGIVFLEGGGPTTVDEVCTEHFEHTPSDLTIAEMAVCLNIGIQMWNTRIVPYIQSKLGVEYKEEFCY